MSQQSKLLTRDHFREGVFARDLYKCVVCGDPAKDAHHIIERRLFDDGGYYLDNGASLCEVHHIEAEKTLIDAQWLRDKIGIKNVVLPKGYYRDTKYDKWGNIILPNGMRMRGELFEDESVQKILSEVLYQFTDYIKYPRTLHLSWSESISKDDNALSSDDQFIGKEVVVTEKMDGENATIYSNGYFHARSISGNDHPSQSWIKSYLQNWSYNIPEGWRVCGENLYATHSIKYEGLKTFFMAFSIWRNGNECLSWDDTVEWANLLDLTLVPVLYRGVYNKKLIQEAFSKLGTQSHEGYVIRNVCGFSYSQFNINVAKYVRKNHIVEERHNWKMCWDSSKTNSVIK